MTKIDIWTPDDEEAGAAFAGKAIKMGVTPRFLEQATKPEIKRMADLHGIDPSRIAYLNSRWDIENARKAAAKARSAARRNNSAEANP